MKLIKAILAGVLTFVIASIVYVIIMITIDLHHYPLPPGTELGIDFRSFIFDRPTFWLATLAAFALGFWWAFRRTP